MPERPVITLGGVSPFEWSVKVYRSSITGLFHAVVVVASWHAVGQEYVNREDAKLEGCSMMANMTAELEDLIDA